MSSSIFKISVFIFSLILIFILIFFIPIISLTSLQSEIYEFSNTIPMTTILDGEFLWPTPRIY